MVNCGIIFVKEVHTVKTYIKKLTACMLIFVVVYGLTNLQMKNSNPQTGKPISIDAKK